MSNLPRIVSCICADIHCALAIFHGVWSDLVSLFTLAVLLVCCVSWDTNIRLELSSLASFPSLLFKKFWLPFVRISSSHLVKLSSTQNVKPIRTIIKVTFYLKFSSSSTSLCSVDWYSETGFEDCSYFTLCSFSETKHQSVTVRENA